jgi:hypothetical protein
VRLDEAAHYLRALSITNGVLVGPKASLPHDLGITAAQYAWAQKDTRGVSVSAEMSPPPERCVSGRPPAHVGKCVEPTNTGDYHPLPYLLPAVTLAFASDADTGLWLARGVSVLLCLVFVVIALAALTESRSELPLGALLALTPTALFVMSVVNPNGLEVASSLAVTACTLRIWREPERVPSWLWIASTVSAAVATLSWQLGPVFVLVNALVGVVALGGSRLGALWRANRRPLSGLAVVLAAALSLYTGYGIASGVFHSSLSLSPFGSSLRDGAHQLRSVLHQAVGNFGVLNLPVATWVYVLWWAMIVGVIAWAGVLGHRRERVVLGAGVAIAVVFPIVFYAWVYRNTGFGLQARYVLPVLTLPSLIAAEIVSRRAAERLRWPWLAAVVSIAVLQLYSWDTAARAAAGAPHRIWFLGHALWSPPLGWWPWLVSIAAGTVLLVVAALQNATRR